MKQNINIEAEGSELILKNKAGDYVIIPKKYRTEVQDMIKNNCHGCIDALVETLPMMDNYAEDGSLYPEETRLYPKETKLYPEETKLHTIENNTSSLNNMDLYQNNNKLYQTELSNNGNNSLNLSNILKKPNINKQVEDSNKAERDFMNSNEYLKLLQTEYEAPFQSKQVIGNRKEMKDIQEYNKANPTVFQLRQDKLNKLNSLKYDINSNNVKADNLAQFNVNTNTIEIPEKSNSMLTSILSHEREHGTELNVPGSGFQKKLYEIYKNKGIIDPNIKLREKNTPEYIFGENVPIDNPDIRSKLPIINKYAEWLPNGSKYYTIKDGVETVIGDEAELLKYFDKNYPKLFTDNKNWKQELRDYKEMSRDKFRYIENHSTDMDIVKNEVIRNNIPKKEQESYINKRLGEISKERSDKYLKFKENAYLFPFANDPDLANKEQYQSKPNPAFTETNNVYDVIPQGYTLDGNNYIYSDKLIPSDIKDKEFYYYSPIEVKARLKAVRDYAKTKGFKVGMNHDIKEYLKNIDDEGTKIQYEELINKVGLTDDEINELMNYFALINNNEFNNNEFNNKNNNIV